MATAIDKLFKGYTIKEIEEILFKQPLNKGKAINKSYTQTLKSRSYSKRTMAAV